MTDIMYIYIYIHKADDLTPALVIAIFSYLFKKAYQNFIETHLK
jgi:hypothetical protein